MRGQKIVIVMSFTRKLILRTCTRKTTPTDSFNQIHKNLVVSLPGINEPANETTLAVTKPEEKLLNCVLKTIGLELYTVHINI